MVYILGAAAAVLFAAVVYQGLRLRKYRKDLDYISNKIHSIIEDKTEEKVMVFTDSIPLQVLIEQINNLLDEKNHSDADNRHYVEAMRKMLANMSHDLKTPLTVVNGYIESMMLNRQMDKDQQQVLLEKVHAKSQELIGLMTKFFDLAKLESGDYGLAVERVDVCETTRQTLLSHYELLERSDMRPVIEIPDTSFFIQGDQDAIHRIVQNLITNAVSYGYEGHILGITVQADDYEVAVRIWDKGRGIGEKYLQDVFERLYTLEDSRNKDYQGSGLGLTITKRLVEKMNGRIGLTSIPYERTEFSITFPRLKL